MNLMQANVPKFSVSPKGETPLSTDLEIGEQWYPGRVVDPVVDSVIIASHLDRDKLV